MKTKLTSVALLVLTLSACGSEGDESPTARNGSNDYATGRLPTAAMVQQQTTLELPAEHQPTAPSDVDMGDVDMGDVVMGRALSADGVIPETERTERFATGEEIHVAVPVRKLAPQARVRVAWFGPHDDLLAEDARSVPAADEDEYVSFSMRARDDLDPGEYRAEIWMNDEKIDEQRFALVAHRAANAGSGGS